MSKFLILILSVFAVTTSASAQTAPSFCSGANIDMTPANDSCITTCKAVAARSASYLSNNTRGFCIGQATYSKFTIFKLALGRDSAGTEALCDIWNGELPIINSANAPGAKVTGGPIDLSRCAAGTYDTVHVTMSRFTEFAGNTVFPNASGTGASPAMVRTTAPFSNSTTGYATINDWLEDSTSHSTNSKPYVRPSNSWNTAFKKLAATPSATDLTSSSDVKMYYDELKGAKINDAAVVANWLCEAVSLCTRQDPNDQNQIEMRLTSAVDVLAGLPVVITKDNACTLDFQPSYYAFNRGSSQEMGIKFLWHNDAGTLKYLGAYPGESGLMVTIGKPTCGNRG